MYSNFDYIYIDPQYYFSRIVLDYFFFTRLLEIKKYILRESNVYFNIRGEGNVIQSSLRGGSKIFLICFE